MMMASRKDNSTTTRSCSLGPAPNARDEIPATSISTELWKDMDSYADVELKGSDGITIKCQKSILACRSVYFRGLFYGHYSEATATASSGGIVALGYAGFILKLIVEYCYTDKIQLLCEVINDRQNKVQQREVPTSNNHTVNDTTETTIGGENPNLPLILIQLQLAADYFRFPKLSVMVSKLIKRKIEDNPPSAWDVLVFVGCQGKIGDTALDIICNKLCDSIQHGVPSMVTSDIIVKIVSDPTIVAKEIDIFRLIQSWVNSTDRSTIISMDDNDHDRPPPAKRLKEGKSYKDDDGNGGGFDGSMSSSAAIALRKDEKMKIATSLIETHIQFNKIEPSDVADTIEPSGLLSTNKLNEVYKQQALELRSKVRLENFDSIRGPHWKNACSKIAEGLDDTILCPKTDILVCEDIRPGREYIWSIKVLDRDDRDGWFGVVMLPFKANRTDRTLDHVENSWAYNNNLYDCGVGWDGVHDIETAGLPIIGLDGSIITITLDLTQNGSFWLEENRDDGTHVEKFQVFDNMLMEGDTKKLDRSFAPAVTVNKRGKIEFLGFHNSDSTS